MPSALYRYPFFWCIDKFLDSDNIQWENDSSPWGLFQEHYDKWKGAGYNNGWSFTESSGVNDQAYGTYTLNSLSETYIRLFFRGTNDKIIGKVLGYYDSVAETASDAMDIDRNGNTLAYDQ